MAKKLKKAASHTSLMQSFLLVIISFLCAFILFETGSIHILLHSLREFGYIGAFFAGMFFVSVFTAAPAAAVLLMFSETLSLIPLVLIAGAGAVAGDLIILSVIQKGIHQTESAAKKDKGLMKIIRLLRHTKYRFFLTLVGAIVVASPLPDELGLALMGISRLSLIQTIGFTFFLNTAGLLLTLLVFK